LVNVLLDGLPGFRAWISKSQVMPQPSKGTGHGEKDTCS
jgi:hypothetical protein